MPKTPFIVVYRTLSNSIEIAAILHTSRQYPDTGHGYYTSEREKLSRIVMGLPDNKVIKAIDLIENLSVDGDEPDTMTRRALFREYDYQVSSAAPSRTPP